MQKVSEPTLRSPPLFRKPMCLLKTLSHRRPFGYPPKCPISVKFFATQTNITPPEGCAAPPGHFSDFSRGVRHPRGYSGEMERERPISSSVRLAVLSREGITSCSVQRDRTIINSEREVGTTFKGTSSQDSSGIATLHVPPEGMYGVPQKRCHGKGPVQLGTFHYPLEGITCSIQRAKPRSPWRVHTRPFGYSPGGVCGPPGANQISGGT